MRAVHRADNITTFMCRLPWNLKASNSWIPQELSRTLQGLLYLYTSYKHNLLNITSYRVGPFWEKIWSSRGSENPKLHIEVICLSGTLINFHVLFYFVAQQRKSGLGRPVVEIYIHKPLDTHTTGKTPLNESRPVVSLIVKPTNDPAALHVFLDTNRQLHNLA
jgi:hypothetical protein